MIICFEEKDRAAIESTGNSIIEYKRYIHNMQKILHDACKVLDVFSLKFKKVYEIIKEAILEAADIIKMYIEVLRDIKKQNTTFRYKVVKFISKCTGIEFYRIWKATRHIWMARDSI